jgi:hypothetical protein
LNLSVFQLKIKIRIPLTDIMVVAETSHLVEKPEGGKFGGRQQLVEWQALEPL